MATKKISELEAINAAEDNDVLVIVDTSESTTNKITKGNLLIGAGHTIEMTLNENYQIVLVLKNAAGTALSTQTIDLPNENAITNLAYNNGILTITKQSGATSQINLTGLIEGLVTESDFNTFKEALQTTLEAINEKDAEQDEAIAENYKVINKLNEKLENQQKVIDQLPQVTGQGTSITLENTIEAQFTKFDVEGNSTQETTTGKNLLPNNATTQTYFGITITKKDNGTLILNGTATDIIQLNLLNNKRNNTMLPEADIKYSLESGIYKLSGCTNGSSSTYKLDVWVDGAVVPKATCFNQEVQFTLDEEKIISYLRLVVYSGATLNNVVIKPMVRLASVTDDTYEPYTGGIASPNPNYEQPIESAGDNGSINEKIQNKNFANNAGNGYIASDGGIAVSNVAFHNDFIPIPENETKVYYYGSNLSASMSNVYANRLFFYDENKGKVTVYSSISTPTSYTIPNGAKYVRASWLNAVENPMLVFGGAIPYVPHEEQDYSIFVQQPFRSIGDVRDCFVEVNGNWYERHYISKVILDGTEPWTLQNNCFTFTISDIKLTPNYADRNQLITISNYYIAQTSEYRSQILDLRVCKTIDGGNPRQVAIKDTSKTLAEFKAWLAEQYASGKPVYVDYLLAEPLDLPCTEEQIQQLENLPSTYKDFTIIQSEDETEAYLEVSGIYDLNKLITRTEVLESEV